MNKTLKSSIFKTSLMALLLTSAFSAQSAGLGKLSVYSGIGQQLNAEVGLTASPGELNSMSAKLASHEAFSEAGIEYMSVLSDVRISMDKNAAGQPVLKLTTLRPISEPFLHFLVELSWTSGRMVREYTFLLDPPELLQVAKPASVVAPAAPVGKPLAASTASPVAPQPKPVAGVEKKSKPSTGDYQVKPGDTLAKIARETGTESITLDQMLVALFNGNQDAFSGNNMNRLRAGKILRVPSVEEAGKVDPAEARKLVIGQAGEFNAYRNRLAGVAAVMPASEVAPKQQVSGTIKPQVEDKMPAPVAKDKLEVSRTEPVKTGKAAGSSLEEDLVARDKALREASERIAQLEKNIENLKQLVEVKSQTGAKLQQESEATAPKSAEPTKAEAPVTPAPIATAEQSKPDEPKPAAPAEAARSADVATPVSPPPAPPVAKKPTVTPPPPLPESSFIDENPEIVYGGGGLVALLLGYLGYSSWRRKKAQEEESLYDLASAPFAAQAGASAAQAEPTSGTPATSFDTGEISIQGEFSESGLLTNEEIVDPVAEADVLMAYGRDRQAEEILQEGLNKDPSRSAIHMKLLELYAKQENIAQFELVAKQLHDSTNGRGADWEKTLAVARTLGLTGGVFAGAAALAEAAKVPADTVEPSVTVESVQTDNVTAAGPRGFAADADRPEIEVKATPAEVEVPSLEFDLDLGTTTGSDIAAVAEQAVSTPAPAEDIALDFDFDLGTPEAKEAVEAVVEKAEADTAPRLALDEMDFDLDLGSPVDIETPETIDVSLADIGISPDLPMTERLAEDASAGGGIADLKLDFDLELEQEPAAAPGAEYLAAQPFAGEMASQEQPAAVAPLGKPDNPEVATKLELAQAYEEMGDLDGARELLNEVVNEGSDAQQAEARAKLDQLSA